jgi:hypothetical protein
VVEMHLVVFSCLCDCPIYCGFQFIHWVCLCNSLCAAAENCNVLFNIGGSKLNVDCVCVWEDVFSPFLFTSFSISGYGNVSHILACIVFVLVLYDAIDTVPHCF